MVYRTSPARLKQDQTQREFILGCAHDQVAEAGFVSLTMSGLAHSAGVATGSLYRHFPSKAALACEVFIRASRIEVETLSAQFTGPTPASHRLRQGLTLFAARAWQSRQLAFALIAEPVEPEVDAQRLVFREAYAELFSQLLREGVADGSFKVSNIPLASACLVGAVAESLVGPLSPQARAARASGHSTESLGNVTTALTQFCLRALASKELES